MCIEPAVCAHTCDDGLEPWSTWSQHARSDGMESIAASLLSHSSMHILARGPMV